MSRPISGRSYGVQPAREFPAWSGEADVVGGGFRCASKQSILAGVPAHATPFPLVALPPLPALPLLYPSRPWIADFNVSVSKALVLASPEPPFPV